VDRAPRSRHRRRPARDASVRVGALEDALAAFTGERLDPGKKGIDRHRDRARAILSLAGTLTGIFDLLPVSRAHPGRRLSETHVQSPAALTRALASAIGFAAPSIPQRDRLGASAAAFHGGRVNANWRGLIPVVSVDYSKTYAMISALLRIQDYLAAEQIRFEDATAEARELAQLELPELLIRDPVLGSAQR
jgi:hypothetical protein